MVQVKPTIREKCIKKACNALLKYFQPYKFKSEQKELFSKQSVFARAKRSNPKKYFRTQKWDKNGQNVTVYFQIYFSQTTSFALEPFLNF